jgi:hypothetical protein
MATCLSCVVREAKAGGNYCGVCLKPKTKGKVGVSGAHIGFLIKPPKRAAPAKKAAVKKSAAKRVASKKPP